MRYLPFEINIPLSNNNFHWLDTFPTGNIENRVGLSFFEKYRNKISYRKKVFSAKL